MRLSPQSGTEIDSLASPNRLSPELAQVVRAQGSNKVENPQDGVGYYGYDSIDNNPPLLPVVGGAGASLAEAHKIEPDKNTYLVLRGQQGPDAGYNYGTHFLFQGHETGTPGYISRINLDAGSEHRVTILSTRDSAGNALPNFDGSTWNPYAHKLPVRPDPQGRPVDRDPAGATGAARVR